MVNNARKQIIFIVVIMQDLDLEDPDDVDAEGHDEL